MLHYNPQHVSSSTLLIFRKTNCIITVSGIVTLCKRPYRTPVEGGLSPFSTDVLFFDFLTVNMRAVGSFETSVTSVTCQKTTICSDDEIWEVWGSHRYVAEDSGMWCCVTGWSAPDVSKGSFFLGCLTIKIRTLQSFETSGTNYGTAQCRTREHLPLPIQIS